jgi:tetratricopeptide (TPR) repeat protein
LEGLFAQARAAQTGGDLRQAEAVYGRVLMLNPRHVGALNGLGIIHAQTQRLDSAIGYFERALALEPQAAHLHNNLGYALLLGNRLSEAESALQRARQLNPSSTLTDRNLALLAQAKERAAAPVVAAVGPSGQTLVVISPSVYELRDPPSVAAAGEQVTHLANRSVPDRVTANAKGNAIGSALAGIPAQAANNGKTSPVLAATAVDLSLAMRQQARSLPLNGVRLEVSNGVGIRHMALRTAQRLEPTGVVAARLTNQPRYAQVTTEIQFSPGQTAAADALSRQLPLMPAMKPVKYLERNVQLRLVLGHDLVGKSIAAWLDDADAHFVVLDGQDGWLWG